MAISHKHKNWPCLQDMCILYCANLYAPGMNLATLMTQDLNSYGYDNDAPWLSKLAGPATIHMYSGMKFIRLMLAIPGFEFPHNKPHFNHMASTSSITFHHQNAVDDNIYDLPGNLAEKRDSSLNYPGDFSTRRYTDQL
ncbi:hypothetical protein VNO77_19654 [Canavalia gladiata]|uniref:Uncharacterized protein n=1 Tax=Canavalia gladiata TaxID=3824 RepID=A0AAN9LMX8_CANGL